MVSKRDVIRLAIPYTDDAEAAAAREVLATGYLTQGPRTADFERRVAERIGCELAFATSSCTTALHLALVGLGVKAGDEVAVADFTFPATANVVVQQGARPILVDVDLDTFTMSPRDLRAKLTPRTKAIIVVDTFGCSADYDALGAIADEAGVPILEDAACAIGTTYRGRACGSLTKVGCFSFHPRKVITTGEGGMITTSDPELADKIRLLRSHGGRPLRYWLEFEEAGFNYRLSDILSAIGLAQMDKLDWLLERRRALAARLSAALEGSELLRTPTDPEWGGHIFQSFVVLLDDRVDRDRVVAELRDRGVESTLGTYALHDQPYFQRALGHRPGDLPNSDRAFRQSLTLPLYPQMEERDLDRVAEAVLETLPTCLRPVPTGVAG